MRRSTPPNASRCAHCYTRAPAPAATLPAWVPCPEPPRWRIPRGSRPDRSVVKPSAGRWPALGCAGSALNTGSPVLDPAYVRKKRRDRLMALAVTYPTWAWAGAMRCGGIGSPNLRSTPSPPPASRSACRNAPRPEHVSKALACYGLVVRHVPNQPDQMLLRFVVGRPVSPGPIAFLAWCRARLAVQGLPAGLLIWDNASWHINIEGQAWPR
jgi:hypothetical protein